MKKLPFNLKEAKNGAYLINELGNPARLICTDAKRSLPIIALVTLPSGKEEIFAYDEKGIGSDSSTRLYIASRDERTCKNCKFVWRGKASHIIGGWLYICTQTHARVTSGSWCNEFELK